MLWSQLQMESWIMRKQFDKMLAAKCWDIFTRDLMALGRSWSRNGKPCFLYTFCSFLVSQKQLLKNIESCESFHGRENIFCLPCPCYFLESVLLFQNVVENNTALCLLLRSNIANTFLQYNSESRKKWDACVWVQCRVTFGLYLVQCLQIWFQMLPWHIFKHNHILFPFIR